VTNTNRLAAEVGITELIETARSWYRKGRRPPDVLYVTEAEWQVLLDRFPPPNPDPLGMWHRAGQPMPSPPWLAREGTLFGVPIRIDDSRARRQRTLPLFMDLADVSVREGLGWRDGWGGEVSLLIEQRLPGPASRCHLAGLVVLTAEILADLPTRTLVQAIEAMADPTFRPWLFPDRNPMPRRVTLFPRLERLLGWRHRWT
jgi:hypothetical protein